MKWDTDDLHHAARLYFEEVYIKMCARISLLFRYLKELIIMDS